jgi:hypothetical protein
VHSKSGLCTNQTLALEFALLIVLLMVVAAALLRLLGLAVALKQRRDGRGLELAELGRFGACVVL